MDAEAIAAVIAALEASLALDEPASSEPISAWRIAARLEQAGASKLPGSLWKRATRPVR